MARIVIKNLNNRTIEARNNNSQYVLNIIHENNIDWMYACGGKGRCTTCKFIVLKGASNLSSLTAAEESYFNNGQLQQGERLACQCKISGDITIQVPLASKFPHMKYSD